MRMNVNLKFMCCFIIRNLFPQRGNVTVTLYKEDRNSTLSRVVYNNNASEESNERGKEKERS